MNLGTSLFTSWVVDKFLLKMSFLFAFWEGKQPIQKPSCKTTFWTFAKNYNMELFIA